MDEFEYQLRAEQEEQEGKRKEECSAKTYVDPSDGTVYEWDNERNGWFPKVHISNILHHTCSISRATNR